MTAIILVSDFPIRILHIMERDVKDLFIFVPENRRDLFKYKNRTTGIASTAGKFASAFAKGAEVYKNINPEYSELLLTKAIAAFRFGMKNPGVCQTAPGTAPYFYEEDNWVDDMELAAIELYNITKDTKYLKFAREYGRQETVTPWMGSDTARHYQWYPFVNMGHPAIARAEKIRKWI